VDIVVESTARSDAQPWARSPPPDGNCLNMSDRIKVLNIIGCGRSGSTILGNTLGQMPGYLHVGELCYIWNRSLIQDAPCGCGHAFSDCAFWCRVLERSKLSIGAKDAERLASFPRYANRRMAMTILRRRGPYALAEGIEEYLDALTELYRALHAETDCRVIIDSTKAPSHSYLLRAAEGVDLYVVHLVRDARAVAYSWDRKVVHYKDSENQVHMDRFSSVRSALKWAYANLSVDLLRKSVGRRILTVRYEDFVADPRGTVSRIARLVDEDNNTTPLVSERQVRLDTTHTVWGNPSRLKTGLVELRLDSEWQKKMSARKRAVVTGITWPLLRKYAYLGTDAAPSTGVRERWAGSR
jgi:hypothetical protein